MQAPRSTSNKGWNVCFSGCDRIFHFLWLPHTNLLITMHQPLNCNWLKEFQLLKESNLHQPCSSPFRQNEKQECCDFFLDYKKIQQKKKFQLNIMMRLQNYWVLFSDFYMRMTQAKTGFSWFQKYSCFAKWTLTVYMMNEWMKSPSILGEGMDPLWNRRGGKKRKNGKDVGSTEP